MGTPANRLSTGESVAGVPPLLGGTWWEELSDGDSVTGGEKEGTETGERERPFFRELGLS